MISRGYFPALHIIWNDGCFGQFKSARAWYFVCHYPNLSTKLGLPQGCQRVWNFFTTCHGKGEFCFVQA